MIKTLEDDREKIPTATSDSMKRNAAIINFE